MAGCTSSKLAPMIAALCFSIGLSGFVHEPSSSYSKSKVQGFSVWVSEAARKSEATKPALAKLEDQLKLVVAAVPRTALPTLRKVKIFIEDNNPGFPCACYHPSAEWLKQNGYNLDKVDSVEISNTTNFVEWVDLNQPYMVLHELAHGFHDLKFGYGNAEIESVYQKALKSGRYDSVEHNLGGKKRAYALNNQMEYFAELSEAYFGRNDFQPFNRQELATFDPEGYALIEKWWAVK